MTHCELRQRKRSTDWTFTIIRELSHSIEYQRFGVLHPIRRVPSEILKEIFEYAVYEEDGRSEKETDDSKEQNNGYGIHIPRSAEISARAIIQAKYRVCWGPLQTRIDTKYRTEALYTRHVAM